MAKYRYDTVVDTGFTPPKVTTTPVVATPEPGPTPPPPPAGTVYRTKGRRLYDPNGEPVRLVGAEQTLWRASWLDPAFIGEIGESGATGCRFLPYYTRTPSTGDQPCTIDMIEAGLQWAVKSRMFCDLAVDGGQVPDVWYRPEVMALIRKYEPWIGLHLVGESGEPSDVAWARSSIASVKRMREQGVTCPLYVMGRTSGRNLPSILKAGRQIIDADPEHNIIFGWQAYWGSDGHYQREYGMSLEQAMRAAANAPFMVQVGLINRSDPQDGSPQTTPYLDLMRWAKELDLSWFWWDWRMGIDNLTTDGQYGHWATWNDDDDQGATRAQAIAVSSPHSIARSAARTPYQLAQKAPR